jgi:hypothetical protein
MKPSTGVDVQVSPNPANENIVIKFAAKESQVAIVRFVNTAGQVILSKQVAVNKGVNNISVNQLGNLPTGN